MLYMIELHYSREHRDATLRYFWEHGSTHYEGKVTLTGAWVATQDLIAYALVDAADPDKIAEACAPLAQFGDVSFRHVTSVDEI
jgi:hypothetical protein